MTGPFEDRRPPFWVFVTGHPDAIPSGYWQHSPSGRQSLDVPGVAELRSYLDAVLYRRRDRHRLAVLCRGGRPCEAGVDAAVRAYCEARGIACLVQFAEPDLYGPEAEYRRDLDAVARAHAVVWFGPRVERDPVTLAAFLGVPCRVAPVRAPALALEEEDA